MYNAFRYTEAFVRGSLQRKTVSQIHERAEFRQ